MLARRGLDQNLDNGQLLSHYGMPMIDRLIS
jgi:hypothetical protein